ncbi:hypothetical protein [Kitasatospora sp. NPDC047058]|uniref:hypothetical protein n=1 Tax=Kitasatospora sp. NPDC047058 TaxID=3155620 RepID=UPI0033D0F935
MLGRTRRENRELRERAAWLESRVRQLNLALGATRNESQQHFERCERISNDRVAQERTLTGLKLGHAATLVSLTCRIRRLARGCARYRAECARLQHLVDRADALADRAVQPAVPTPEIERLKRDVRQRDEIIHQLQNRIDGYQRASEALDWQAAPAATVV